MTYESLVPTTKFSLYDLIDWNDVSGIVTDRRSLLTFWSHCIEKAVIEDALPADMIAGFQSLDRIAPVLHNYRQIARVASSLMILGLPSRTLDLSGLNTFQLNPDDPLVREWFLIVRHPDYNRALIAREVGNSPRSFHGILTSDPAQVERFYAALTTPFL